ncbi:hypothetical protein LUZ60_003023 [Juncus effusus]|nr:hypothetical protein LUZ60_003023 [Juncus effusus]
MASVSFRIVIFLLLVFHIGVSVSAASLFQSQKTKISSRKGLFGSDNEREGNPISFSSSKSFKKKPSLESKEEKQISSSKVPKKKPISDDKEEKQISSSSKIPRKKLILAEKIDKVTSKPKSTKKKLSLKEEVEKLIAGDSDIKPLKKNTNLDPKPLKSKKPNSNSITTSTISTKSKLPKLNKTSNLSTKSPKPLKPTKSNSTNPLKTQIKTTKNAQIESNEPKQTTLDDPSFLDESNEEDLISDLPDLIERLSSTSRAYISAANSNIAEGVKPFLGTKYAPIVAPIASALFLIVPLFLLISLLKRLESCLSLVRNLLVFIQAYLAIYFATLAVTAVVTGLEPLRFFYATSASSYTWTQVAQSFGYVVYLVLQLVDLLAVFSSSANEGSRALALAQMLVGLAVGLHYYAAVFHRAVMGEPPRANWRVHGVYAACFMLICICARAERRKKAYVSIEGAEEWKKS